MSQNVNVNLVPGNYPKEFHVSQYDVGRQLVANIVDSTGAYSIPSGATVTLVGTKPSGFGFTLSGSVGSGGVVTFSTTATVTAEYGRIPCEIRIESGNTVLGTANCMLIVEESPHPEGTTDGDGEVIVNQITLLLEQITQQVDRVEATLSSYAKVSGEYDGMTVGTAKQLLSDSTTTDTEPYIYRQTAGDGDREEVEVVGGTVAWNQLQQKLTAPNGSVSGVTATIDSDGYLVLSGTATENGQLKPLPQRGSVPANHVLLYMADGTPDYMWGRGGFGLTNTGKYFIHKYSLAFSAVVYIQLESGHSYNSKTRFNIIDLTAMFGSTVADAIYAMEQASAGAGVAWFKKLFNKSYYPYNAGELMSVKTSAHVTTGFNQWDEEWEVGSINGGNGANLADNTRVRSKNLCRCLPNVTYARRITSGYGLNVFWYDANEGFISYTAGSDMSGVSVVTAPDNACYFRVATTSGYGNVYKNDICINISDPDKNGAYEPYDGHTYPLSPIDLRGIPKWVDGKLVFDGDAYSADGVVTRNTVYRSYQSGDESLANAITDGSHTVVYSATATTETATPYTAIQVCDPDGTEEWTDERTVQIPVGNVTKYHANLKEKLEEMPAVPTAPSANGTYTLKATVSGGAVTYQWVNG